MSDVRNFRKYIEELSGNNLLIKKMKALEKRNTVLERSISELKEDMMLMKKHGAMSGVPKKKGRKPRPMIRIIEDEMSKKPGGQMAVKDIIKMLKKKNANVKTTNIYSSVASSLTQNPKFEKVSPGLYRLKDAGSATAKKGGAKEAAAKKKPGRKKGAKKK